MKKLILMLGLLVALTATAFAAPPIYKTTPFTSYTGLAATARYSTPFNTGMFTKKTVIVNGMYSASVYGNFTGTVVAECAQVSTGPFVPCKDVAGNAISTTTNSMFNIDSLAPFVRMKWTKTKHRISVWMFYSE